MINSESNEVEKKSKGNEIKELLERYMENEKLLRHKLGGILKTDDDFTKYSDIIKYTRSLLNSNFTSYYF